MAEENITFHPDVLAAHAQFGGDLVSMQKCYDWYDLKAEVERRPYFAERIDQLEAELDAARLEVSRLIDEYNSSEVKLNAAEAENERLQEQLSACMELVDPSAMELGTYKARATAAEAREKTLREALQKIADAPAWGYPERWEATPSEVRHLARAALKGRA